MEAIDIIPFCYGASKNVYPSGMARDMGGGLMAYKIKMGQKNISELVENIFNESDDIELSTVNEQKEYFEKWIKTNGKQD